MMNTDLKTKIRLENEQLCKEKYEKAQQDQNLTIKLKEMGYVATLDIPSQAIKQAEKEIKESEIKSSILFELVRRDNRQATELAVKHIEENYKIYTLRNDVYSEMYIYEEGIFVPEARSFIKEFCREILGKTYSGQFYNEVIQKIEADTYINEKEFFENNQKNIELLPVQNGILNLTSKELLPFTPEIIFFNKLPIAYIPGAECPEIIKHFKAVLESEEDLPAMQELTGSLLWKDNFSEQAFMFAGDKANMDGRNGKTKTLSLFKKFVGADNCCSIPIQQLEDDQFSYSELFNKMVNIAGDISDKALKNSSKFKMSVGRDTLSAQRKNKQLIHFVNYAKHLFACNKLPLPYDNSLGFWSKWVLFNFPYVFVSKEEYDLLPENERSNYRIKDPDILEKITTSQELSGMLNWALEGLNRLRTNKGRFSHSKSSNEVRDAWRRKADSFSAFLMDCLQEEWDGKISKEELRRAYSVYCKEHKLSMSNDQKIKGILTSTFSISEEREMVEGKQVRFWSGIIFKIRQGGQDSQGFSTYIGNVISLESTEKVSNQTTLSNSLIKLSDSVLMPCSRCGTTEMPCKWQDKQGKLFCDVCHEFLIGGAV